MSQADSSSLEPMNLQTAPLTKIGQLHFIPYGTEIAITLNVFSLEDQQNATLALKRTKYIQLSTHVDDSVSFTRYYVDVDPADQNSSGTELFVSDLVANSYANAAPGQFVINAILAEFDYGHTVLKTIPFRLDSTTQISSFLNLRYSAKSTSDSSLPHKWKPISGIDSVIRLEPDDDTLTHNLLSKITGLSSQTITERIVDISKAIQLLHQTTVKPNESDVN